MLELAGSMGGEKKVAQFRQLKKSLSECPCDFCICVNLQRKKEKRAQAQFACGGKEPVNVKNLQPRAHAGAHRVVLL